MRNLGLDVLRAVAIFLVLGRHFALPQDASSVLLAWQRGGWVGVDLFFVLSGFLVSSLLFEEYVRTGQVNTKRFIIRRGFKIYPPFWVFIAFSLFMRYLHADGAPSTKIVAGRLIFVENYLGVPTLKMVAGELLFLQNYWGGIWNHTWSLAVEEHFYVGIATLFFVMVTIRQKRDFTWVPIVFGVIAITCLALRGLNLLLVDRFTYMTYLFGTHIRIDSLFFGVLLAYYFKFRGFSQRIARVSSLTLIVFGMTLLSPAFIFTLETSKWVSVAGVILFYIGSGFLVCAALRLSSSSVRAVNVVGALGAASYSIYLWHMPVGIWGYSFVRALFKTDSYPVYAVTYLVGALVFGWLMNRMLERPILAIRDRLFPSLTSAGRADSTHGLRPSVDIPVPA